MTLHMPELTRRGWLTGALAILAGLSAGRTGAETTFRKVPLQYIAALGSPSATSGTGAETWGIWRVDPGPRGVWLRLYQSLQKAGNIAPAGWRFDIDDWWLDENGLIMKAPDFPLPAGKYLVTDGEENAAVLTIATPDAAGQQAWSLSHDARLQDVTHEKCRSARFTPEFDGARCTPENAKEDAFPLGPGQDPPPVADCNRKVYQVLIVYALPVES